MKIIEEIRKDLKNNIDHKFQLFQTKLIPNIDPNAILGVRTPILKELAKKYYSNEEIEVFLNDLPHKYFEENQLHSFILSLYKDYDKLIKDINIFLPYIDNWATCDQLVPKVFKKNKDKLIKEIDKWLESSCLYTERFAIEMLMSYYLDDSFDLKYTIYISNIQTEEYYLKMMIAWYFSFALIKQYDKVIGIIEAQQMSKWVHNKTIQKAIESARIPNDRKEYLKSLKIK